jgi:predicted transposase/invertase (TIGR01784 family)
MHHFSKPNDDEMIYDKLDDKARFYKQDETGVQMASKIVEEYGDERAAEALKQGIQQGEQKRAIEDAKNLYANGVSIEIIAKSLKMTIAEVQNIIKK